MSSSSHLTAIGSATQPPSGDEAGQQIPRHLACAARPPADILIDGSISYMFGSRASECYFGHLLKDDIRRSLLCWDVTGWPGACFTSQGVLDASAVAGPESGTLAPPACLEHHHRRPGRLLDYDARGLEGTIVPQAMWRPQGQSAIKKYVVNATLQWPVFFVCDGDRTVGFPLQERLPRVILGGQTYAPLGGQSSLQVRIKWPGYEAWQRQLQVRDDTHWRNPITLAKFAQYIGRCVSVFLQNCEGRPTCDPKWKIGKGGILPNEVLVLGVVHVSSGTWQPILALTKVVM
ncbi:hypothetical protein BJV74DRAFT_447439 [Russula compacta]|nr:hypothetical protein BJV74DRAFT_447439 [Russula compacta]